MRKQSTASSRTGRASQTGRESQQGSESKMGPSAQRNRMRLYGGIGALLLALATFGWWSNGLQAQSPDTPNGGATVEVDAAAFAASGDPDRPAFVPGELLVGVRVDASARTADAITAAGFAVDETLALGDSDAIDMQIVSVPVGEELQAAQEIAAQPGVVYVTPNGYVWAAQEDAAATASVPAPYAPSDTYYAGEQWNMHRINMARAWQFAIDSGYFAPPSGEVIVAVIDSGVDPTHPELAGRLLPGKNYVNTELDGNGNQVPGAMRDDYGHGTHVTGIIAAALNDGKGVAGIAPMIKIDPRRVLGSTGGGTVANVAQAIVDAADNGARVINLSLVVSTYYPQFAQAVTYASDAGALVVAAAGNAAASTVYYPAAFPEAIAVGALNYWDTPTSYTNHGPEMDIAAPGGEAAGPILSLWPKPSSFPSNGVGGYAYRCYNSWQTYMQDGSGFYCQNYGTSFASPEVAGVAALLFALKPDLSPEQARAILFDTALPLPAFDSTYVGAGKLDAYAAVRALLPASVKLTPSGYYANIAPSAQPFTFTVRIENPSRDPLTWNATLAVNTVSQAADAQPFAANADANWINLSSGVARSQAGSASYGKPGFLTFAVVPSALIKGVNSSRLTITTQSDAGTKTFATDLTILGGIAELRRWIPMVLNSSSGGGTIPSFSQAVAEESAPEAEPSATETEDATYAWETPANLASSQQVTFTATSLSVALPYTVTLGGVKYTTLQLFEDGFVTLPNQIPSGNPAQNRCLPQSGWSGGAVFGWWANLDSHAPGAKVTLFRTSANRVVIQYENMASVDAARPYTASFQIVLDQAGNVRLNYRDVPAVVGKPALATIGAQSKDGRIFSEIACTTTSLTLGTPPTSGESILIRAVDQY